MDDKKFKDMDQSMMKKMESVRQQQISEGMLKGFSASVERRITHRSSSQTSVVGRGTAAFWAPALAVMVLASVAVLRSPIAPSFLASEKGEVFLAEAVSNSQDLQDDLAVLGELGVLDEYEDIEALAEDEALFEENVELSKVWGKMSAIG